MLLFIFGVLALGILALAAGSRPARFFVASNAAVTLTAAFVGASNFARGDSGQDTGSLILMTGQVVEGWLLFGALAYRLQQIVRAFMSEQQRRIVAQAEALAQAHALLESRKLAQTDALTGIANRRAFDDALAREWKRCARLREPISLMMIDVDHFKSFNDTYGHVLGDDALRRLATAIARCAARPTDLCARYGGEEFVLLLPETSEEGARGLAADVVLAIRTLGIAHRGSSLGRVTASIGVETVVPGANAPESLVKLTDTNLYRAKRAGRNRYASSGFIDTASETTQNVDAAAIRTDLFTG
jgi:diguanylate cyclase (GGDEF)-like protein